jgi:hypothetical protein
MQFDSIARSSLLRNKLAETNCRQFFAALKAKKIHSTIYGTRVRAFPKFLAKNEIG